MCCGGWPWRRVMRSNSQPRAVMSSGMCQVRVEVGVGGGGGVPGVGEVRRHPSADLAAESTDHMYVVLGVWVEEIPVAGVEIDAFDVDALGGG